MDIETNLSSDNVAPCCSEIIDALRDINKGNKDSYGQDHCTLDLNRHFSDIFEIETVVFPATTGTAANSISLATLTTPWSSIICDQSAHINTDEGGAPEFFTGGSKIIPIPSPDGRINPEFLKNAFHENKKKNILEPPIHALSLTQATEWGTVYPLEQCKELTNIAHSYNVPVHLDGARLGNAIAHLNCSPAEATWKTGIDILVFGGTKSGALAAEAIVIFPGKWKDHILHSIPHILKRSGHLWSKERFISCQLHALLNNNLWLNNAKHANSMAKRLVDGLRRHPAAKMPFSTDGNEVFVILPEQLITLLHKKNYHFYPYPTPHGVEGTLIRFVTSFATKERDIDALLLEINQK